MIKNSQLFSSLSVWLLTLFVIDVTQMHLKVLKTDKIEF